MGENIIYITHQLMFIMSYCRFCNFVTFRKHQHWPRQRIARSRPWPIRPRPRTNIPVDFTTSESAAVSIHQRRKQVPAWSSIPDSQSRWDLICLDRKSSGTTSGVSLRSSSTVIYARCTCTLSS